MALSAAQRTPQIGIGQDDRAESGFAQTRQNQYLAWTLAAIRLGDRALALFDFELASVEVRSSKNAPLFAFTQEFGWTEQRRMRRERALNQHIGELCLHRTPN